MRSVIEIARAELKRLFFSPIAWLVLVAFTYQVCTIFNANMALQKLYAQMGGMPNITHHFFAIGEVGGKFFLGVQGVFYFYIPLLTMNILSRDFSSGSIKLLYSSPVSNWQIILGKYLCLVIFGAIMLSVVAALSFYVGFHIEHADWPIVINGLVGVFLLHCSYAAVGLFISSLTSYALISVISTFAVLAILRAVGNFGQEIPIVRDLTYWFSMSGRSATFIEGLISTESILYFITVIGFFLSLAWVKLNASRGQRSGGYVFRQYMMVFLLTALVGYASSLPTMKWYWDLTRSKVNTLSKESQRIVQKLDGGLTITSYSNMLNIQTYDMGIPKLYKSDVARYENYVRFKPEIKLDYKYYYHYSPNEYFNRAFPGMTPEQILDTLKGIRNWNFDISPYGPLEKKEGLAEEEFRFVSVLKRDNGKKSYLRVFDDVDQYPDERQISAALKGLVEELPTVGFVTGHGERNLTVANERGYMVFTQQKTFRFSLINNGFDFVNIDIGQAVPDHIRILVIPDAKQPFSAAEMLHFQQYVNRGGNIILATEPGREWSMGPLLSSLGIRTTRGTLIQPKPQVIPEVIVSKGTAAADSFSYYLPNVSKTDGRLIMNTAVGLDYVKDSVFEVTELFKTDSTSAWNEVETTNFMEDSASYHPAAGEVRKPFVTALSLSRKVNNKQQKIVVTGDADWLSNGELQLQRDAIPSVNYSFIYGLFSYLTDGELPIDTRKAPPIDNHLSIDVATWDNKAFFIQWGLAGIILGAGAWILIRRKGR